MTTKTIAQLLEIVVRNNLTFKGATGELLPQDLFALPLTSARANTSSLDAIALALNAQLEATDGKVVSFVKPTPAKADFTQVKFDLVKAILDEKMAERDKAAETAKKRERAQAIMAELANREDKKITTASDADLQAELAAILGS